MKELKNAIGIKKRERSMTNIDQFNNVTFIFLSGLFLLIFFIPSYSAMEEWLISAAKLPSTSHRKCKQTDRQLHNKTKKSISWKELYTTQITMKKYLWIIIYIENTSQRRDVFDISQILFPHIVSQLIENKGDMITTLSKILFKSDKRWKDKTLQLKSSFLIVNKKYTILVTWDIQMKSDDWVLKQYCLDDHFSFRSFFNEEAHFSLESSQMIIVKSLKTGSCNRHP